MVVFRALIILMFMLILKFMGKLLARSSWWRGRVSSMWKVFSGLKLLDEEEREVKLDYVSK